MKLRTRHIKTDPSAYEVLVVGASWGGVSLLSQLVSEIPATWWLPVVIVQHQHPTAGNALATILSKLTCLPVIEIENNESLLQARIHIAPANYHLLMEDDRTFSLSLDAPVNYSRPSIDVTFTSIAKVFGKRCMGLLLTGANEDGTEGVRAIHKEGGYTAVQDPDTAEADIMPKSAIATGVVDVVLAPQEIIPHFMSVSGGMQ